MTVKFKWSGCIFTGNVITQEKSSVQGQKTVIETTSPLGQTFTIYGKFELGNCGPFTVLSIT